MQIQLTRGQCAVIDDGDWPIVSQFSWYATPHEQGSYYAATGVKNINGKWTTLYMHRLITGAPKGKEVDHRNHDTLDNRRENLSVGSKKDNMANGKYALTTHCPKGHAYDEANTCTNKKGKRICLACANLRNKAVLAKESPEKREVRRQRVKAYYLKNYEKMRAIQNAYAAAHREEKREYDRLRRERMK